MTAAIFGEAMRGRLSTLFRSNTKGSVAIVFGLAVPLLIGFTGLAVDGTFWLKERNKLQAATDGAAISAAQALQIDAAKADYVTAAKKLFQKTYGTSLAAAVHLSIEYPPSSGAHAGDKSAVAIIAQKEQHSFFLPLLGIDKVAVKSRAVAHFETMKDACLLSLSETEDKAIEVTGNAGINLGCGMASNSKSPQAIYLSGNSNTSTTGLSAVGDVFMANNAKVSTGEGTIRTYAEAMTDPYGKYGRNLQVPKLPTACTATGLKIKKNTPLTPGRYCGGIDFQNGTATLSPGVYIIDSGDFKANALAKITGNDVTIVLTASSANNIGRLDFNGGVDVSLHAPPSGTPYDGILFFQDPAAATKKGGTLNTNYMNGNATMSLSGAMYFPNQEVRYSGSTASTTSCLQIVSYKVRIDGNAKVTNTCSAANGTSRVIRETVELVE